MTNLQFFIGSPIIFNNKIAIYPPKIKDIANQEKNFWLYVKSLTLTQEEIGDIFEEQNIALEKDTPFPTPYEYLVLNCVKNKEIAQITENAFKFFTKENIRIIDYDIVLIKKNTTDLKQTQRILPEEFFDFQNAIRESIGQQSVEKPPDDEDPRVSKIKAKARLRDKIKAKQNKGISLVTTIKALCCYGLGLTPLNIGDMSYASVTEILSTLQDKEKYDTDIRALLAGANAKKLKPKYWIKEE